MKHYNSYSCTCGYKFKISHSVIRRTLNCIGCGRAYWYGRDLKKDVYEVWPIGRHTPSKTKFERRLLDVAKREFAGEGVQAGQEFKEDKESSGLRGKKDPNTDKSIRQSRDKRSDQVQDRRLPEVVGEAHDLNREIEEARVAE